MTPSTRSKEHVIGRGFVPHATLEAQWNLILWACEPCNRQKAELEDDISAITMQPDLSGGFPVKDPRLRKSAERKARGSFSRRTRKAVSESQETMEIAGNFGPARFTFSFISPPQADRERVRQLARLHAMAFFYFVTYEDDIQIGHFWPGSFMPIHEANRQDWGNELQSAFAQLVREWEPRVFSGTADGYFKIAIRRCPERELWSLALEWNCQHRIIAAFGAVDALNGFADSLPKLVMQVLHQADGSVIRMRQERPLSTDDDCLFVWEDEGLGSPE